MNRSRSRLQGWRIMISIRCWWLISATGAMVGGDSTIRERTLVVASHSKTRLMQCRPVAGLCRPRRTMSSLSLLN